MTIEDTGRALLEELVAGSIEGSDGFSERLTKTVLETLGEEEHSDEPVACRFVQRDALTEEVLYAISGYDLRLNEEDRYAIDLFITLGYETEPTHLVTPKEAAQAFALARAFAVQARLYRLHEEPGIDAEVADVARALCEARDLAQVRLTLVTNGLVRDLEKGAGDAIEQVSVVRRAIDLRVIDRLRNPQKIRIEFASGQERGLPCVRLPGENETYRSYLAVVPGQYLADLYAKYAQRLLDANVRSYLRASGKVNRGILQTIRDKPEMFFAYNNGVTATAEGLAVEETAAGPILVHCTNLQIVNGGQTTASLYQALQRKVSLDRVFVPMKISEVRDPSRYAEVVQQISIHANSQNKVSFSDLGANLPFHVNLAKIAETEKAPVAREGASEPAWWFYERMRGQYGIELSRQKSAKEKKAWEAAHPKHQVLTKTLVARYVLAWEQLPHVVSAGGEKTYRRFVEWLREREWSSSDSKAPDTDWFRGLIAKALLFEHTYRRVVNAQIAGHRPNVTAYVVALLARERGATLDLSRWWKEQRIDEETDRWIVAAIPHAHEHILKTPKAGENVGEWSKKEACWQALTALPFGVPRSSATVA